MNSSIPWRRSNQERVLAGVCGGIAKSLHINPNLLRVLLLLCSLWVSLPWGIVLYVVAVFFLPIEDETDTEGVVINKNKADRTPRWLGIVLVVAGGYLLAGQLMPEVMRTLVHEIRKIGPPLILIAVGMWLLLRNIGKKGN